MIMICYFGNIDIESPLFKIKNKLEDYVTFPPYLSYIKSVNTIIGKTNKTFSEILKELSKNNKLRSFKYDLILNELNTEEIPQNFE